MREIATVINEKYSNGEGWSKALMKYSVNKDPEFLALTMAIIEKESQFGQSEWFRVNRIAEKAGYSERLKNLLSRINIFIRFLPYLTILPIDWII